MIDVFLSASVPLPDRDRRFFENADVLAIRESIKALVEVVLPIGRITFGGHPAITPLISFFVQEAGLERERLTIFQSQFFQGQFPEENAEFHDVRVVEAVQDDRAESLRRMRIAMIESRPFCAAVAIGGMEGVSDEISLFRQIRPSGKIMPIASTGAAAREVFDAGEFSSSFKSELTYLTLFRRSFDTGTPER